MKERKKEFPTAWLSNLQKEILKTVCSEWIDNPTEPAKTKTLNWDIARKLNSEKDKRIEIGKKEKEILTTSHSVRMNKSLKRLRERKLIHDESLFGKGSVAISEEGKKWCELNIDGFKEVREEIFDNSEKSLLRRENIKNENEAI